MQTVCFGKNLRPAHFDVLNFGVAPEFFQVVKCPFFLLKYVADHVQIVKQNPLFVLKSFFMPGVLATGFENFLFNGIRYGIHLSIRVSRTNNKIIGDGVFYFSKIKNGNVVGFFFQHTLYGQFGQLAGGCRGRRQMRDKNCSFERGTIISYRLQYFNQSL